MGPAGLPQKAGNTKEAKWPFNGKAPTVSAVEALNEIQKLEELLGYHGRRLTEAHLGIPVDRRHRKEAPRRTFRATYGQILEAEKALRLTWRKLRRADFSPLVDAATQPTAEASVQMALPLAVNGNGADLHA